MKHVDLKSTAYIDFGVENPKFKLSDRVMISKYKTFFQKAMLKISLKKFMRLKYLRIPCRGRI